MRTQVAQHDIRRVLAGSRTAQRHAIDIVHIYTLLAACLVKTDIDSLTHIGTQINRVRFPFGFPELMRRIAFLLGGIIGIQHLE